MFLFLLSCGIFVNDINGGGEYKGAFSISTPCLNYDGIRGYISVTTGGLSNEIVYLRLLVTCPVRERKARQTDGRTWSRGGPNK